MDAGFITELELTADPPLTPPPGRMSTRAAVRVWPEGGEWVKTRQWLADNDLRVDGPMTPPLGATTVGSKKFRTWALTAGPCDGPMLGDADAVWWEIAREWLNNEGEGPPIRRTTADPTRVGVAMYIIFEAEDTWSPPATVLTAAGRWACVRPYPPAKPSESPAAGEDTAGAGAAGSDMRLMF